jgi:hypothetical protein
MKSQKRLYSSRILKAGALLDETKMLLSVWDEFSSTVDNIARFRQENILGKASRSRSNDILRAFYQRYLVDERVMRSLILLIKGKCPANSINHILYFHTAMSDSLIHDFVADFVSSKYRRGLQSISVNETSEWIKKKISAGKTVRLWSDNTIQRSSRGLMSALRDFGVLKGLRDKQIAAIYVPVEAFCYIAFYLHLLGLSGKSLLESPEWRLFLLEAHDVERLFIDAHQVHLLEYRAAGSAIRIDFPVATMEEYSRVILEREH